MTTTQPQMMTKSFVVHPTTSADEHTTDHAQTMIFDGVHILKRVHRQNPPPSKPEPIPIDVDHPMHFDPADDSAYIDDPAMHQDAPAPNQEKKKRVIPQNALQCAVNHEQLMRQVLDMPISLPMKDMLGVSETMAKSFQELLKKSTDASQMTQTNMTTPAAQVFETNAQPQQATLKQYPLSIITVEVDGHPLDMIVDSGSEVNLVHRNIAKKTIQHPLDPTQSMNLHGATEGSSLMDGMIEQVPLRCGVWRHCDRCQLLGWKCPL